MSINVAIEQLPQSLRPMAEKLQASLQEYQETQQQFSEAVAETKRLTTAAAALDSEAEQANQQWKALCMERHSDQRKINGVIERSIKLKGDADALRRTAEVRDQLHDQLIMKMAPARFALHDSVDALNSAYCQHRLSELLDREGWAETVGEILGVSSRIFTRQMANLERFERVVDPLGPVVAGGYNQATLLNFAKILMGKIEGSARSAKTTIASLPAPVTGEVVASNRIALKKLLANGGKIPDDIDQRGGNHGPTKGLKKTA